ncbi:hypothetical protein C8R44DRAFT_881765 [Mycena epipterygia]|nr:hypothetical protein C8R44DRAFT_881765 [Mycena epipterygia]
MPAKRALGIRIRKKRKAPVAGEPPRPTTIPIVPPIPTRERSWRRVRAQLKPVATETAERLAAYFDSPENDAWVAAFAELADGVYWDHKDPIEALLSNEPAVANTAEEEHSGASQSWMESPQWLYFLSHARDAMREPDRRAMDLDEKRENEWADRQGIRDVLLPWRDYSRKEGEYVDFVN